MCSKTDTEILYEPDPDIDIEEFKQEPMNVSEMISCLSSETNSLSESRNLSSETGTEIVYNPDPDIDVESDQNLESNEYIAHDHNYVKPKL